jgi:hypothetical protein
VTIVVVFIAIGLVLAKKAVPLVAHGTANDCVNRAVRNVLGKDKAHQLRHDLLHLLSALCAVPTPQSLLPTPDNAIGNSGSVKKF